MNISGNSSHPITVLDTKYFNWTIKQLIKENDKVVLTVGAENYTDPLKTVKTGSVQIVVSKHNFYGSLKFRKQGCATPSPEKEHKIDQATTLPTKYVKEVMNCIQIDIWTKLRT